MEDSTSEKKLSTNNDARHPMTSTMSLDVGRKLSKEVAKNLKLLERVAAIDLHHQAVEAEVAAVDDAVAQVQVHQAQVIHLLTVDDDEVLHLKDPLEKANLVRDLTIDITTVARIIERMRGTRSKK